MDDEPRDECDTDRRHCHEHDTGQRQSVVGGRGADRRRRGRWGLLQDRLSRAAAARGIDNTCSNPELARRWAVTDPSRAENVRDLAIILDRVVFDPTWTDSDDAYETAAGLGERLDLMKFRRRHGAETS